MPKYVLTAQTRRHIDEIRKYTSRNWGKEQAKTYLEGMSDVFGFLAKNPDIGRNCEEELKTGVLRFIYERHAIYYRETEYGIAIIGVLHQSMVPWAHLPAKYVN